MSFPMNSTRRCQVSAYTVQDLFMAEECGSTLRAVKINYADSVHLEKRMVRQ